MKMAEIRGMAKNRFNINSVGMSKTELVRKIQTAEGNFACFRTAEKTCDQEKCLWLDDCVGKAPDECTKKNAACSKPKE
jgi:hypothetical protein